MQCSNIELKVVPYEMSIGFQSLSRSSAGDRSHKPSGRLPLFSATPAVTSPAAEHHRPLAGTKLYCLMTEAHVCKQLAQGCTQQHGSQDSNPRPVDHKSGFLTTQPPSLHCYNFLNFCLTSLFCWRFLQVVLGPHSSSKEDLMVIAGVNVFIGQMPFQSPNQQWSEGLEVHDVNELVDYLSLANYCFFDG